jgi:hypothetical protein
MVNIDYASFKAERKEPLARGPLPRRGIINGGGYDARFTRADPSRPAKCSGKTPPGPRGPEQDLYDSCGRGGRRMLSPVHRRNEALKLSRGSEHTVRKNGIDAVMRGRWPAWPISGAAHMSAETSSLAGRFSRRPMRPQLAKIPPR